MSYESDLSFLPSFEQELELELKLELELELEDFEYEYEEYEYEEHEDEEYEDEEYEDEEEEKEKGEEDEREGEIEGKAEGEQIEEQGKGKAEGEQIEEQGKEKGEEGQIEGKGEGEQIEGKGEEREEKEREESYLTVLQYLKEQKKIRDLLSPVSFLEKSYKKRERWVRCEDCGAVLYLTHVRNNDDLCMGCGHHLKMSSFDRIELVIDIGSWRPLFDQFSSCDPLEFEDYNVYGQRSALSQESTDLQDAIQTGTAFVDAVPIALAAMDFGYMGGSMGSVVGEKLTRLIEYATTKGLCLLVICASGGARMQEGSLSLMQMAKISSALHNYQKCANLSYINILTSPTTGGVTASFGMLADFIFTEPKSIIGFAGRRVIEATLGEILPSNFQTAEYLLEKGHVDLRLRRRFVREILSNLIWALNNGNYKAAGFVKRGLHNGLTHMKEERARRVWNRGHENSVRDFNGYFPNITDEKLYASLNKRIAELNLKKPEDHSLELPFNVPFPYTNSEFKKFLENPKAFLKALNQGKEPLGGRKRLEKVFNYRIINKLHGIGRTNFNKSISLNKLKFGNNWKFLNFQKRNHIGNNGTGNGAMHSLVHSLDKDTVITGMHSTGIYSTWTGKGILIRKNNEIEIDKPQTPLIKRNTLDPVLSSKSAQKRRVSPYLQYLKRFFLTRASNSSYLKILGTFEAVVHLFNSSIAKREEKKCKNVSFAYDFQKDSLFRKYSAIDEAVAFAKAQSLHWRNVYDGASAPQKLSPFQASLYRQKEKRFFYYILEKHINLLEKRKAYRLAHPEEAANERRARRNAAANALSQAVFLETTIERDFRFFLEHKVKQAREKK